VGTEAETLPNPTAYGVSLAQYAAVRAGLLEGLTLDVVLAGAGVKPSRFSRAEDAWDERLAESGGGDGVLLRMFDAYLADAQDRYRRPIPPLDDDLRAWLDFVRCWAKHEEPTALLRQLGLRTNDMVRLHRAWMFKLAADSTLNAEATKILEAEPGELPLPGPLVPVTFAIAAAAPHVSDEPADSEVANAADNGAEADEGDAADAADETVSDAPPLFTALASEPTAVAIRADNGAPADARRRPHDQPLADARPQPPILLTEAPTVGPATPPRPEAVPPAVLLPPVHADLGRTTAAPIMSPFATLGDPGLKGLPFAQRAPGDPSPAGTSSPAPLPIASSAPKKRSNLDQTVMAHESPLARGTGTGPIAPIRPASPPLPFTSPASAPRATSPSSPTTASNLGTAQPPTSPSLGETTAAPMMSPFAKIDDPARAGLPFAGGAPIAPKLGGAVPARSERGASAPPIGSMTGDLPTDLIARLTKGALPFPAAAAGPSKREPPVGSMTGALPTDLVARIQKGLPFQSAPGTSEQQNSPAGRPIDPSQSSFAAQQPAARGQAPGLPFPQAAKPDADPPKNPRAPNLTLKQYASLCAELAVSPQRADATFRRYGFESAPARREVDQSWRERLQRNPVEYREWQALYQHYQMYWTEQTQRRPGR
jgi:hypothetical protein